MPFRSSFSRNQTPIFRTVTVLAQETSRFTEDRFKEDRCSKVTKSIYTIKDIILAPFSLISSHFLHYYTKEAFLRTISYESTIYNMSNSAPNAKKLSGKGLGWNDDELLALAHAAPKVCQNPAVGKQISRKEMGEWPRNEMIGSTIRLSDACIRKQSEDHRDDRRWQGRSGEAYYRKWSSMRADFTSPYGILKIINSLNLTGNFSKQDKFWMAIVEFSCGKQVLGHLYNIGNNKE